MKLTLFPGASILRLRAQARSWGWPGLLGSVCVLLAAAVALGWSPYARREVQRLAASAAATESRAARLNAAQRTAARVVPASERFIEGFPPLSTRQERIAALLALASAHHLESQRSEFQQSREAALGLVRLRVTMPLAGPYPALRDFIDEAQERDPTLSLDSLRLRRASAAAASIAADLTWSIYLQDNGARPNPPAASASAAR